MPRVLIILLFAACLSCERRKSEVVVTETRPLTTKDAPPKLDASSDQRFRDTRPSPVEASPPADWLVLPATQMRLLNYRFGESGMGEAYVTVASGSVLDNVNRWLGQFNAPSIDTSGLEKLKRLPVAHTTGVLVTSSGTYSSGMNAPPRDGFGLAGLIAEIDGQILTIKLVGPKAEVEAAVPALESFASSLKWQSDHTESGD